AQYWIKNPVLFTLVNEKALNTTAADWAAVNYKNGIVFTSDRLSPANLKTSHSRPFLKFDGAKLPDPKNYGWTGNNYLRLYEKSGPADSMKLFPVNAGTSYHVGAASFTADGNTLYFTLTRIPQKITRKKGRLSTINTEIYSSSKDTSGNWGKPVRFKYNNVNEWSTGDPFISEDGKTLYFASDMPGGKGGMDIYSCTKKSDDNWTDAVNITAVNTNGNERSPFIAANGNFYFSSDGRVGMGGLDIYTLAGMTKTGVPRNMGYPVNSPQDDFAFNLGKEDTGFLSSNRPDGAGSDDIYSFTIKKILKLILEGKVYDRKTNLPIEGALVTLNKKGGKTVTVLTGETGTFSYDIDPDADFNLKAQKTNYTVDEASLTTMNLTHSTTLHQDLFLETIVLNKVIMIRNIYYDFDQSNIRPDAAIELDKLVSTMKTNETISIMLSSYTDSRGKDQYNQWLSQKRANSAVQYIVSKGIDKSRIIARGYGETHLLNHCSNGVKCSEEMHQLNRRTEFKIIKE
ncbi:MAG TPA: OmpA family protein, partial [Pedobacter sp.]